MKNFIQKTRYTLMQWKSHSIVRNYGVNFSWSVFARMLWIFTALTVGILVTRKLGPEQFGVLNYSIAWIGMFAVILDLGVSGIIQRELILHPEQRDDLLGRFACFRGIQTFVLLAAAGTILLFSGQTAETVKLILILMAGYLGSFGMVASTYFYAAVQNKYEAFSQIISCVIYNTLRVAAVLFDMPLEIYAAAESIMNLSYSAALLWFYNRKADSFLKWKWQIKGALKLLIPSVPLSLSGIFTTIYTKTDVLMLEHFQDFESVGFYSLASRFTLNIAIFLGLTANIFSAAVSGAKKISDEEYHKQLHRFYFLLFWCSVPLFPFFQMISPFLFSFLYGEAYSASASIFSVCLWTLPATGILNGFFWHATLENRLKTIAAANGAGALINIGLNWLTIPAWNGIGAAWSSVVALPCGFILVLLCTKQNRSLLKLILKSIVTLPSFRLRKES